MRFQVIYQDGDSGVQVIEADDYVRDGHRLLFRDLTPEGSFAPVMRLPASVVDRIVEVGAAPSIWTPGSPDRRSFSFSARESTSPPGA
jgi:hypothetical protein